MSDSLPGGAKIPVTFAAGQPLTENELNTLQRELLRQILTHTHGGNELPEPQGVQLKKEAIAKGEINGGHIADNAITKGHIAHGAVGGSEIGQRQVGPEHLVDGAVVTRTIAKGNVTLEKLSDDVQALLNAPREGATTNGYFAWLDGRIAFPGTTQWFDWLVDPNVPVRAHDLPILRMRDDGGWQPIEVILPPEQLRPHVGDIIGSNTDTISNKVDTRTEMADVFSGFLKDYGEMTANMLGGRVIAVQPEGSQWVLKLDDGQSRTFTDAQLHEMVSKIGAEGIDLGGITSAMTALKSFGGLAVPTETVTPVMRTMAAMTAPTPATFVNLVPIDTTISLPISIITQPIKRVIIDPRFQIPIQIDTPAALNVVPTEDLTERNRVAMEVSPQEIGWDAGVEGRTVFHPGTGANLVFNDANEPVTFQPDRTPSTREMETISRMLYHYDIADVSAETLLRVGKSKVYDFLNNPHLMPAGYWTGASQNVRAVMRMLQQGRAIVRVKFNVPYLSANYVVHVTPELDRKRNLGFIPMVVQRAKDYVDIGFMTTQSVLDNKVNFNLTIHGELAES